MMSDGSVGQGRRVPVGDVLLSAIAAVSWALIGMAGVAALGLHLLGADETASLGPMTAALVALGAGGSVTPSGDMSAFGLDGAQADTALQITPLGVSLVGALLLSWFFLRSLRGAGAVLAPAELLARAGTVAALFVALLGGLAWAGHDIITIDGGALGLDKLPGGGVPDDVEVPGLGNIGGLLPDRLGDLADAKAKVGFTVDTVPTLLGGLGWVLGVLLIALLASRRTPLPGGWTAVHRVVRPAVSALVTVLLVAVLAGFAAAAYAAIGDENPKRIAGAALLGAPNGVWLGVPIGLFVPWDGTAKGPFLQFLPDPMDDLLKFSDKPVTLSRLAELDGRVWLLGIAAALMMLFAGVLTAARTPFVRERGVLAFAARCALRLAVVTALVLPLLVRLTEVSVNASLSVLGIDAFDSGIELRGQIGMALLLGALWGAVAGAVGALLACASGAAGRQAAPLARGDADATPDAVASYAEVAGRGAGQEAGQAAGEAEAGPYRPGTPFRPTNPETNPYLRIPEELRESGPGRHAGPHSPGGPRPPGGQPRDPGGQARPPGAQAPLPHGHGQQQPPGAQPRPPGGQAQPPGAQPQPPGGQPPRGGGQPPGSRPPDDVPDDVYGAQTMIGPIPPASRPGSPGAGPRRRPRSSQDGPPPPPDELPPPPPPRKPGGRR
ncbi:streptophobe family protein [Streptomyces sp. NPDC020707]|uniref:streptophobe family protein n=1 Tax=Streptomyces sp. NPDC020707 TaxID=3365084 RepID=UPI0037AE809E